MADKRSEGKRKSSDEYGHLTPLFRELASLDEGDPRRAEVRERLVTGHLPLAEHIAQRFAGKGIAKDDLVQVASVGLIHAVDRFDPDQGAEFLSYAVPTVMGEVRGTSATPVGRCASRAGCRSCASPSTRRAANSRSGSGRPPTDEEMAEHLDITVAEVQEGYEARQAYRAVSLDEPPYADEERLLARRVGGRGGRRARTRREPRVAGAAHPGAAAARAQDPGPALLRRHDPDADRRGGGHLADARLPAAPSHVGGSAGWLRPERSGDGPVPRGAGSGQYEKNITPERRAEGPAAPVL